MIAPSHPMSLDGKTIIVTGAAQGIGLSITRLCLELGANVVLADRNAEALSETANHLPPDRILTVPGDVTDESYAGSCVGQAVSAFKQIDGLVNNAGIIRPAMLEKMTLPDWQQVLSVHLTGAFLMTQAVGRHLLGRARQKLPQPAGLTGSIVNISSTGGKRGAIGQANYAAAKAGIFGLTMTAALEWAKYGIRCNSVGFGTVITPMTEVLRSEKFQAATLARIPLGRFAEPEEAAPMVAFLLSDSAAYITGENLTVSGGMHMQP